jgi:hypothetical protein
MLIAFFALYAHRAIRINLLPAFASCRLVRPRGNDKRADLERTRLAGARLAKASARTSFRPSAAT